MNVQLSQRNETMNQPSDDSAQTRETSSIRLWIDGVGSALVFSQPTITLGGERWDDNAADITIQAALQRVHAEIIREGDECWLNPLGPTTLNGRNIASKTLLQNGYEIGLAESVKLKFVQPSPLSGSARLEFVSLHRPATRTDAIVIVSETCLIGPSEQAHIVCPKWPAQVVLFRQDEELMLPALRDWTVNETPLSQPTVLRDGDLFSGPDCRFRVERRNI